MSRALLLTYTVKVLHSDRPRGHVVFLSDYQNGRIEAGTAGKTRGRGGLDVPWAACLLLVEYPVRSRVGKVGTYGVFHDP